ncbi:MAG TPA: DUF1698 domain-containing protein [Longimicrobiaceae bacterium]|nr:DUF1698 domain-containing protein [Longimicrobiaceae bacterium]
MTDQELRDRIVRLGPWHHDLQVAPGIRTGDPVPPGTYPPEVGTPTVIRPDEILAWLVGEVFPDGLQGRSVLDCACNAGGFLFAAARMGAGRSFGFDVRSHWITQARFLSEHLPGEQIGLDTLDLARLPERRLEPFDVTLFMGIFYHLPDPVTGLRIAADHTRELLVVNTAVCPGPGDALVLNRESETAVMSGVHGLAWLPTNDRVIREVLRWCGFPHTRLHYEGPAEAHRWRRIVVHAARDASTFAHYDAAHPPAPERRRPGWVRRLLRRA